MADSPLERALEAGLRLYGPDLPKPRREYHAIDGRRFRFDFAYVEARVLVEVQGGIYSRGRSAHNGASLARDYEKLNAATVSGWRVLMFGPRDLDARKLPATVQTIREAIEVSGESASRQRE